MQYRSSPPGIKPVPLQWKSGTVTTRLLGKFLQSLSFPGCAIVEIIQYLVFSDWLVSLVCMSAKSLQSYLIPCNPMDGISPGSPVHGILQARIQQWVAMPSSRGSSRPSGQTGITYVSCIGRQLFTTSATWETLSPLEICIYVSSLFSWLDNLYFLAQSPIPLSGLSFYPFTS